MKKIRMVLSSDFSIAEEQAVLTPALTNPATSRKAAKPHQIYIHAEAQRNPLADRLKKSGRL